MNGFAPDFTSDPYIGHTEFCMSLPGVPNHVNL